MLLKKGKTTKNQSKNENLTAKSQKRKEKSKKKRTKRVLQRTLRMYLSPEYFEKIFIHLCVIENFYVYLHLIKKILYSLNF